MCTTPAPPSTALVAASICSGTGEVNTAPGHAASSMPRPTKPPCSGSWPEPPPETSATFPRRAPPPPAGDERDLSLPRRARAHHDLRGGVHAEDVAVRGGEAGERLLDDLLG